MNINEMIFLDKVGPLLLAHANLIKNPSTTADDVLSTSSLNLDIKNIDDVDDKEKQLFMELFHKIYNMASSETRDKAQAIIMEMLEIYELYKSMC
jgi:hypothetical protein